MGNDKIISMVGIQCRGHDGDLEKDVGAVIFVNKSGGDNRRNKGQQYVEIRCPYAEGDDLKGYLCGADSSRSPRCLFY